MRAGAKCLVIGSIPPRVMGADVNVIYVIGDMDIYDPIMRKIESKDPLKEFPDGSLDYIYVESQEDADKWKPKLVKDGILEANIPPVVEKPVRKVLKKVKKMVKKKKK